MVTSKAWNIFIKNKIEISITCRNPNKTIKYLKDLSVNIYKSQYLKNELILIISLTDYSKIKKYFPTKINRYIGPRGSLSIIKHHFPNIITLVLIILTITIYTRIIIDIDILTNNQELYRLLKNELEKATITKYSFIKSDIVLENIKEQILNNHKTELEWLNIKRLGMKYIINLEPRLIESPPNTSSYCHIIATKDATITKIYSSSGTEIKEINETVKKGDILISGDITVNEEVKGTTCASGTVYGNTWYTINITVPKTYETYEPTGKKRYNITLKYHNNTSSLLRSPFSSFKNDHHKLLNIFGLEIFTTIITENHPQTTAYSETELDSQINKLVEEKMSHTLKGNSTIKYKKVLKKEDNNSTIYLDMFIVAEEEIGEQQIAPKIEE